MRFAPERILALMALIGLLLAVVEARGQELPWPDAAPRPPKLEGEFAEAVMKPVVFSLPGMDRVMVTRDLQYRGDRDPYLRMDVYRPAATTDARRLPTVIFLHGGAGTDLQPKDWGIYQAWGRLVAAAGYVGVTFTHRLSYPRTQIEEGAADVRTALDYVRTNAARLNVDPDRICLAAYSAGGPMLAPYMDGETEGIRCLVGYYPFMDIRQTTEHQAAESAATRNAYSPILHVKGAGARVPMLLVRAGNDRIPTLLDSVDRFVAAALAADYPLTVVNKPGGAHGFDNTEADARSREIIRQTLAFYGEHLGAGGQ